MEEKFCVERFYELVLRLTNEWEVIGVRRDNTKQAVYIDVVLKAKDIVCPICGKPARIHDHRIRRLRHLDTCEDKTYLDVEVPRIECSECGVNQVGIDFADKHSLYTASFENIVIDKLKGATVKAVAHDMGLSWDAIDNIRKRAVARGLARRKKIEVKALGIDETSRGSHYDFISVLVDHETGNVIEVLDGKNAECVIQWFNRQMVADLTGLCYISMDMSNAFISAVKKCFPDWDKLIVFDRFHVVKMFLEALNKVRAREHKKFLGDGGESILTKLKFELFKNSGNTDNRGSKRRGFLDIMRMHLESSRAWKIKETQNSLWEYSYMGSAEKNWKHLIRWMLLSRIDEMKKLAHTIKDHLWGILNAIKFKASNALLESTNSVIQHIKRMACGYRNDASFRTAILFHLGGLDLAVDSPHNP